MEGTDPGVTVVQCPITEMTDDSERGCEVELCVAAVKRCDFIWVLVYDPAELKGDGRIFISVVTP